MYEDTYTEFNSSDFKYGLYCVKNIVTEKPFAEWDYGDTFIISFDLTKELEVFYDLSEYFVIFKIFNYRYEVVYEGCGDAEKLIIDNVFRFSVDSDLSNKLVKGNYTCLAILKSADELCTLFTNCWLRAR